MAEIPRNVTTRTSGSIVMPHPQVKSKGFLDLKVMDQRESRKMTASTLEYGVGHHAKEVSSGAHK